MTRLPLALVLLAVGTARVHAQPDSTAPSPGAGLDPSALAFPGGYRLRPLAPSERLALGTQPMLTLGQVLTSVERHHPLVDLGRARVAAAAGEQLAAEGGFDLTLTAEGWGAPVGYYDWARADVALVQPTPLWGATVWAGWRIGRGGQLPDYYGHQRTLDLGEVRAGLRVPLWRDGPIDARRARTRQAEHGLRAEEADLDARLIALRYEATSAYVRWVAAGLRYQVAARLLELAEARDEQILARVQAGGSPPLDALENRRVVAARRGTLVAARRALEQAAIALSLYLRRADGTPWVAPPARMPEALDAPPPSSFELRREIRDAWARRPETARVRALLDRQAVSVELAENQVAPRIDVGLAASLDLGAGTPREQETLGAAVVEGSILFSMPLQLREARGRLRTTRAELSALRADARRIADGIAAEVQDAASATRAAEEAVALAEESAEVAEAVAEAERRRFALGATELFVVNLREEAAAAAQAALVDARGALVIAHARWRAATGRRE
ncbi:MAG: TolC family protein [Sandaracinaceae bacterium]|nr:TolC family protein [Sandaracinaceae bacterium]